MSGQQKSRYFRVLANQTGELGTWPVGHRPPAGWRSTPFAGDLAACERQVAQLVAGSSGPAGAAEDPSPLPGLLRRVVEDRPEAIAVSTGAVRLTFRELFALADELVGRLDAAGHRPGDPVVVPGARTPDLVAVVLAVLAGGGVCVLPGVLAGPEALEQVFPVACPATAIAVETAFGRTLPSLPARSAWTGVTGERWRIAGLGAHPRRTEPDDRPSGPSAHAPALVVFPATGSTLVGTDPRGDDPAPVGVVWRHRHLALLADSGGPASSDPGDRLLQYAPADSPLLVLEVLRAVLTGAELVLPPPAPNPVSDAVESSGVRTRTARGRGDVDRGELDRGAAAPAATAAAATAPAATPAAATPAEATSAEATADPTDPATAASTAAWVTEDGFIRLHGRVRRAGGRWRRTESLALPETGPVATVGGASGRALEAVPPVTLYLLDDELAPVPDGTVGHLYVGGPGVAAGYLDRPDLTLRRFLPDPQGEAGSLMFRTSGRARRLPSGTLELMVLQENGVT